MPLDRELKTTFNEAARLYDEARPGYPEHLFDDVVSLSGIPPEGRILEIGCGTGQATLPFARRGYSMLCLDIGADLAALAAENCRPYPKVQVRALSFEDWGPAGDAFDLVVSATAFHWIDPRIGYAKAAKALRRPGAIALFWNLHANKDADFFREVQKVYRRHAPHMEMKADCKGEFSAWFDSRERKIRATGLFTDVVMREYPWADEYDAERYVKLLRTYSDHIKLEPHAREALLAGIAELIERRGGTVTKEYLSRLYVARAV